MLTLTAGTALVMWMGELITQRGIGNGMSILIFASVVSAACPSRAAPIKAEGGTSQFVVIIAIVASCMLVAIVFVEQGQRRIPVQFAKRVVGRRMYGGQSTYIPLKVNQSGVIPIIFASSVLSFPALIASALGDNWDGVQEWVNDNLVEHDHELVLHRRLRAADHLLRVLLHGDRVRPAAAGRHHPQAGRVHPRHPARAARPSATSPRSSTASRCPARCSSPSSRCSRRSCSPFCEHHAVPLRRHVDPHRRRRRARDDEADRQPADDAQLRGLPER